MTDGILFFDGKFYNNPSITQYDEELEFWRCIAIFEELKFPCTIMFMQENGYMIGLAVTGYFNHDNEN